MKQPPPTRKMAFENVMGKGENSGNQHVLLFLNFFLPISKQTPIFEAHAICCLKMLFKLGLSLR